METKEENDVFMEIGEMPSGTIFCLSTRGEENGKFFMSVPSIYHRLKEESICAVFHSGHVSENGYMLGADYRIFQNINFKTKTGYKTLKRMTPGEVFLDNRYEEYVRVEAEKADDPVAYRLKDDKILYYLSDTYLKLVCKTFPPEKYNLNFSVTPKEAEIPEVVEDATPPQEESTEVKTTEVIDQTLTPEEKPVKKGGKKAKEEKFKEKIAKQIDNFSNSPELHKPPPKENPLDVAMKETKKSTETENSDYVKNFEFRDSE